MPSTADLGSHLVYGRRDAQRRNVGRDGAESDGASLEWGICEGGGGTRYKS